MYKLIFLGCLLARFVVPAHAEGDTVSVYFPLGAATVNDVTQRKIDAAIYNGTIAGNEQLWLIGHADDVGGETENIRLSQARAHAVKSYLILSGLRKENITLVAGKGKSGAHKLSEDGRGYAYDRRVDIIMVPVANGRKPAAAGHQSAATQKKVIVLPQEAHQVIEPPVPPVDIDLRKLAVGETLTLGAIYFSAGHSRLTERALPTLNALYRSMAANPKIRIRIEGHICCTPETDPDGEDLDTRKLELSLNRAKSVRDFLVRKGIAESRMECEGFGRRKPIIKNEMTEREAILNRRVEIRILE